MLPSAAVHPVNLSLLMEYWVRDRSGLIIPKTHVGPIPSASFVKAFAQLLHLGMANATVNIDDLTGTPRSVAGTDAQVFLSEAATATFNYGLMVGTGTTAVTGDDDSLAAIVNEGAGAGQLNRSVGSNSVAPVVVGNTITFSFTRDFNNNSGGTITIGEVGIQMRGNDPTNWTFLAARDVLPATVPVLDTQQFHLVYTFTLTS